MKIKKHLKTTILGLFAGLSISFGGSLFLVCKSLSFSILGPLFFSFGLLLVLCFSFNLYTGKIGYAWKKDKTYILDLVFIYLGNFIGALIFGLLFRLTNSNLAETIGGSVASSKLLLQDGIGKTWYSLLIGGFFCGIFVYLAVEAFKAEKLHPIFRFALVVLCVFAFVFLGFEHCVADMFYFTFGGTLFSTSIWRSLLSLLIITIGNSIGSISLDYLLTFVKKE